MNTPLCPKCYHPEEMHHTGGCWAGLHAASTSVLAFTGCDCKREPAPPVADVQPVEAS